MRLAALLTLGIAASLAAQTPSPSTAHPPLPHFADPANLAGERVSPIGGPYGFRPLPIDEGTRGLEQLLRRLTTRASILNIVAHPDDEDGGMLTYYSRGLGARVADLSLTRGEGGQNAATSDFEDALGLLRTQELLASDRYAGVDQFFGTQVDFGFSKVKAEAFRKWDHDRVLYDVVRAIRIYRPLVITSTWIGNPTDGHGQHQVAGQIAQEAFKAAGDPHVFPEMEREGILPWQPLRMFARVPMQSISAKGLYDYATGQYVPAEFVSYITGERTTTPPSVDVIVHEGATDPLLTPAAALRDELPPSLAALDPDLPLSYVQFARIGLGLQKSQIGPGVHNAPTGAFDVSYHLYADRSSSQNTRHPARSAQRAVEGPRESLSALNSKHLSSAEASFFDGLDISLTSIESAYPVIPTDSMPVIVGAIDQARREFDPSHPAAIAPHLNRALKTVDALIAHIETSHDGSSLDRYNALHELRIKRAELEAALYLIDHLNKHNNFTATGKPALPYYHRNSLEDATYTVDIPALRNSPGTQLIADNKKSPADARTIGYGNLPRVYYIDRPRPHLDLSTIKLPAKKLSIAYLPGTGDDVPAALNTVGLDAHTLTVADLNSNTLAQYDTVLLGVRTYNAHPDLHGAPTQALIDYARNGGNVVVQYQTPEFTAADAPFPLALGSNEKVVDETAPVQLLDPASALLTIPNRISPADFNGWINERGHGFLSTWDSHYTALTETHDPGEPSEHVEPQAPQRGGLITTKLGKGRWTYVAFALYRQLPEAVPGAYRLFVNLITPHN